MNTLRVIFNLALADFYERTRRYRFLLVLAAVIYMGVLVNNGTVYFYVVPADLNSIGFRGEFNSAWIGTMTVLVTNSFLGLFGFFLVNDCIERDIRTGVGQIIATTPVRRITYLVGKWISNFAVLFVLELIMAAAATVMVLLKRESSLDLGALLMPFVSVALPFMALIAALAVVFETVPWLRGAFGNAIYFFLWLFLIIVVLAGGVVTGAINEALGSNANASALAVNTNAEPKVEILVLKDPMGFHVFQESLFEGVHAAFPNDPVSYMGVQGSSQPPQYKVFNWSGMKWTPVAAAGQWLWAAIGMGLILFSTAWFARFDPSREGLRRKKNKPGMGTDKVQIERLERPARTQLLILSSLITRITHANTFLGVLFSELRMLLKGRRWWWWVIIAGLNLAILAYPLSATKQYLLPLALLWPLAIWSEMGNRERKHNTYQLVFSASRPVIRQMPAAWLAGVLATALFGIAGAVVFILNGDLSALAGWAGAVLFIPSLALVLGVTSSGSRIFEVVYLIWWYIGPMQKTQGLDFTSGAPQIYLLASLALLLFSAFVRSRQVRN
jgi:hypothetical protein